MAQPRMLIDPVAIGQDVTITFDGTVDPSTWDLEVYITQALTGPAIASSATVSSIGGNALQVFIPKEDTADLTPGDDTPLYLDVWRLDAGNEYPIVEATIPVYTPARGIV